MPIKDLTGERFGRLVVIGDSNQRTKQGQVIWKCICDCGNYSLVSSSNLRGTKTMSCGCYAKEKAKSTNNARTKDYNLDLVRKRKKTDFKENTSLSGISEKKMLSTNKSGVRGVYWDKSKKRWVAKIEFQGVSRTLGYFIDKQDAIDARKEAEEKYFKPILDKYKKTDSAANETSQ